LKTNCDFTGKWRYEGSYRGIVIVLPDHSKDVWEVKRIIHFKTLNV